MMVQLSQIFKRLKVRFISLDFAIANTTSPNFNTFSGPAFKIKHQQMCES